MFYRLSDLHAVLSDGPMDEIIGLDKGELVSESESDNEYDYAGDEVNADTNDFDLIGGSEVIRTIYNGDSDDMGKYITLIIISLRDGYYGLRRNLPQSVQSDLEYSMKFDLPEIVAYTEGGEIKYTLYGTVGNFNMITMELSEFKRMLEEKPKQLDIVSPYDPKINIRLSISDDEYLGRFRLF